MAKKTSGLGRVIAARFDLAVEESILRLAETAMIAEGEASKVVRVIVSDWLAEHGATVAEFEQAARRVFELQRAERETRVGPAAASGTAETPEEWAERIVSGEEPKKKRQKRGA